MFQPFAPADDAEYTDIVMMVENVADEWFVGSLIKQRPDGEVFPTTFARVTGFIAEDRTVAGTLLWLIDEEVPQAAWERAVQYVAEYFAEELELTLTSCAIFACLPTPEVVGEPPQGRFRVTRVTGGTESGLYSVRFLPEEKFQAGIFDEDEHVDFALLQTFEDLGGTCEWDDLRDIGSLFMYSPEYATPDTWYGFLASLADSALGAEHAQEFLARDPNLLAAYATAITVVTLESATQQA